MNLRTVIDGAGRRVAVPDTVTRVLPTGNPAAAAMLSLAPDKLLGWFAPKPAPISPETERRIAALASLEPLGHRPDAGHIERLRALRPDMVLDFGTCSAPFLDRAERLQQALACPVVMANGRLAETRSTCTLLGSVLDAAPAATRIIGFFDAVWQRIKARLPGGPGPRLYCALGGDGMRTVRLGSIHLDAPAALGASFPPGLPAGEGGRVTVPMAALRAWDPEVIVTIDAGFARLVGQSPEWRSVSAVRRGRVYLAPNFLLSWLDHPPSLNRLISLPWLAHLLYPNRFSGDIAEDIAAFYRAVYQTALDRKTVMTLATNAFRPCCLPSAA